MCDLTNPNSEADNAGAWQADDDLDEREWLEELERAEQEELLEAMGRECDLEQF
jgi:hypothetical protein